MIVDACEIDDSICSEYTYALLILTNLSAIEDSNISLCITLFISCKYTISTNDRFNDSYGIADRSISRIIRDMRGNVESKIILWTDDSGESDRIGFINIYRVECPIE